MQILAQLTAALKIISFSVTQVRSAYMKQTIMRAQGYSDKENISCSPFYLKTFPCMIAHRV